MKVLKATEEQKQQLEGVYEGTLLQFILDNDNNWIISEDSINYSKFSSIKDKLSELEVIDYNPKKINI